MDRLASELFRKQSNTSLRKPGCLLHTGVQRLAKGEVSHCVSQLDIAKGLQCFNKQNTVYNTDECAVLFDKVFRKLVGKENVAECRCLGTTQ